MQTDAQTARERATRYDHVVEVLASDKLAIRPLQPVVQNMPSRGMVYMDPSSGTGMLMCHNLPPIEQGHAYQVWFVRGNERVSGGLLWPDHYGNGYTLIQVPTDLMSFDSVGITDEPGTGSAWPTTPRVIGTPLKAVRPVAPSTPCAERRGSVTGRGGAAAEGGVEALAAGAALGGVGVHHGEAAAHQAVDEVDLRAAQVLQRKRVDDDLDARLLDDFVVVSRLGLERHAVRESRAAARRDEHAQRAVGRLLAGQDVAQTVDGFVGKGQRAHVA